MSKKAFHCFFEQSGTFKKQFKKLGYEAYDYDILNMYNETDYVMDLFDEIEKGYLGLKSVFDKIGDNGGTILAFFPCVRFEEQIQMHYRGTTSQQKNWTLENNLQYDLKLHKELSNLYDLVTKMTIICVRKNIPLIIENPYSTNHYLVKYWCIPYTILDMDRTEDGDYYKKPTQYWFINCKPKNNFLFEPIEYVKSKKICGLKKDGGVNDQVERSLIHPQYANRFIRKYIIEEESNNI